MGKLDQKIHYYEYDNFVLVAKKGDVHSDNDIYFFCHNDKKWIKYISKEVLWEHYNSMIWYESSEYSEEKLKNIGIPLINENNVIKESEKEKILYKSRKLFREEMKKLYPNSFNRLCHYYWKDNNEIFVITLCGEIFRYLKGVKNTWEFIHDYGGNEKIYCEYLRKIKNTQEVSKEYFKKNNIPLLSLNDVIKNLEAFGKDMDWLYKLENEENK